MSTPLLGAPFKLEVQEQLQVRSQKRASQNLTDNDLAVQHGSTGWARISSGVIIDNDPTAAENNILQGGVLNKINKGFDQSGNDSTYTKDINIDQSSNLGFRPIPGVESIEIPNPPYGLLSSLIFEYFLMPGLEILFIFFITGLPL